MSAIVNTFLTVSLILANLSGGVIEILVGVPIQSYWYFSCNIPLMMILLFHRYYEWVHMRWSRLQRER